MEESGTMKHRKLAWLLALLLLPPLHAEAWRLESDEEGIRVSTRKIEGSEIRQFRAETRVPSSIDRVLAVYDDFAHYPEWNFKVERAGLLERPDEGSRYHYQILSMPFPMADRLFVLHSHIQPTADGKVVIETHAVPGYCHHQSSPACRKLARINALMVRQAHGKLLFHPLKDGSTRVTWIQHAEPGGSLPDWLINTMLLKNPRETLENLRHQVKKPRYAGARLRRDDGGKLLGGFETDSR
jgi:hypothetical protein